MDPLLSFGALIAMVFLSAIGLYISSVCASGPQAVVWSVITAFVLMAFSSQWFGFRTLGFDPGFDPFSWLRGAWLPMWKELSGRVLTALIVLSGLAVMMYVGGLAVILRFARANHRSADRSGQRTLRQLLWVGTYFAAMVALCLGMSTIFRAEVDAYSRASFNSRFAYLTVAVVDIKNAPTRNFTVVLIPEDHLWPNGTPRLPRRIEPDSHFTFDGRSESALLTPGRYAVVAVEKLGNFGRVDGSIRDPELIARLKARAIPFSIAAGDSKTLKLTISPY